MNKITELRKKVVWQKVGISQKELAEIVGVSCSMICAIEKGKKNGTVITMNKIAKALGVKIEDII